MVVVGVATSRRRSGIDAENRTVRRRAGLSASGCSGSGVWLARLCCDMIVSYRPIYWNPGFFPALPSSLQQTPLSWEMQVVAASMMFSVTCMTHHVIKQSGSKALTLQFTRPSTFREIIVAIWYHCLYFAVVHSDNTSIQKRRNERTTEVVVFGYGESWSCGPRFHHQQPCHRISQPKAHGYYGVSMNNNSVNVLVTARTGVCSALPTCVIADPAYRRNPKTGVTQPPALAGTMKVGVGVPQVEKVFRKIKLV